MNCTFPACRCEIPAVCKEKTMDKKSKAETLAVAIEMNDVLRADVFEAATHLRQQDALIGELYDVIKRLNAKHGYEKDEVTPLDWQQWVDAREALAKAEAAR